MPHYVPGDKPAVPGHETVVRIVKVGAGVKRYKVGERFLVQTDYRWLPTAGSNSAFGYNFEGALQEYVLLDERVITSPEGESMLIPVPEDLSASAIALVEPWACVEDSYVEKQRQTLKHGGRMLVVGELPVDKSRVQTPARATRSRHLHHRRQTLPGCRTPPLTTSSISAPTPRQWKNCSPRSPPAACSTLSRAAANSAVRWSRRSAASITAASASSAPPADPAAAMAAIPATAEIRPGDKINIIGAAGPMGTMHVIRDLCQGVPA